MESKTKTLFYGYIGVLCLCLIYRLLCVFFPNWEFESWNRLVVAATVSTSVFCISDSIEQRNDLSKMKQRQAEILEVKQHYLAEKTLQSINKAIDDSYDYMKDAEALRLKDRIESILSPNEISNKQRISLKTYIDFIGFIAFLIILLFDWAYKFAYPFQEILTIFAFIVVLFNVGYKETKIKEIEEEYNKRLSLFEKQELATAIMSIYEKRGKD
ncbi:MAG: hypothetical protein IKH57_01125 [Clostridia bacterium]|nr:hypothetical protein [Clostridia bacterium]